MENKKKDAFWLFYDKNAYMMNKHINPDELLPHVGHLIPVGSQEAIRAAVTNKGKTYAIPAFIDALRMRDDSHVHFFNALKEQRGLQELVNFIQTEFIEHANAVSSSNACVQPTLPRAAGDSIRPLSLPCQSDGSHGNAPTAAGSVVACNGASSAGLSTEQLEGSTHVTELLTLSQAPENVSSRLPSVTIPAKAAGSICSPLQSKSAATPSRSPYPGSSPLLYETSHFTGVRTLNSQAASSDEEYTTSQPIAGHAGNREALREGRRDLDDTAISTFANAHGQPGAEKCYASRRQDNRDDVPAQGQEHFGIQESHKTGIPASKTLLPQPKLLGSSQQCPTARSHVSQQVSSSTLCTADERLPEAQQQQLNYLGRSSYRARHGDGRAASNASFNINLSPDENGTLSTLTGGAVAVHRMTELKEADTDRSDGSPENSHRCDGSPENSDIYQDAARALRSFPDRCSPDVDSRTEWTASVLGGVAVAACLLALVGMHVTRH